MDGFLLIDKPAGITSHTVVARLRRITGVQRIGHAGTLDPFATGLLIVGVGRGATKHLGRFLGMEKTYEAVAVFGASSDTQDKDGKIEPFLASAANGSLTPAHMPAREEIEAVLPRFTGDIMQTPPMFSAKKIDGKKMYELAREGITVERKPVALKIHALETLAYEPPRWTFRVTGSSGTYVRTLAHDIGAALGCGAYLEALRRTCIGKDDVATAVELEKVTAENWQSLLRAVPETPRA
ncbi:MAG: tRNA pseudouridine synthase [Candidatus Parcubacteria bacterium]|jgi:tRNA pseudouridine55 synthase